MNSANKMNIQDKLKCMLRNANKERQQKSSRDLDRSQLQIFLKSEETLGRKNFTKRWLAAENPDEWPSRRRKGESQQGPAKMHRKRKNKLSKQSS